VAAGAARGKREVAPGLGRTAGAVALYISAASAILHGDWPYRRGPRRLLFDFIT
jgi:hypothetical protein